LNKITAFKGGLYDCRPCEGTKMIVDDTAGFYLMNVSNVYIKSCQLTWGENRAPYYNRGIKVINSDAIEVIDYDYPKDNQQVKLSA